MAISHANCTHPRTPAGRRACRAGNAPAVTTPAPDYIADHIRKTAANGRMKARMDREYDAAEMRGRARTAGRDAQIAAKLKARPERIQPRRSGARVSSGFSTCVQAALHIDAHGGRCACGWVAEKVA